MKSSKISLLASRLLFYVSTSRFNKSSSSLHRLNVCSAFPPSVHIVLWKVLTNLSTHSYLTWTSRSFVTDRFLRGRHRKQDLKRRIRQENLRSGSFVRADAATFNKKYSILYAVCRGKCCTQRTQDIKHVLQTRCATTLGLIPCKGLRKVKLP